MLQEQLKEFIPHENEKIWTNRQRKLAIYTLAGTTILICTDFSASLDFCPNKTENSHVNNHGVLAIYFVLTNRRTVTTESGEDTEICDTDVYYAFGKSENEHTKNDSQFHNAVLNHILSCYCDENEPKYMPNAKEGKVVSNS